MISPILQKRGWLLVWSISLLVAAFILCQNSQIDSKGVLRQKEDTAIKEGPLLLKRKWWEGISWQVDTHRYPYMWVLPYLRVHSYTRIHTYISFYTDAYMSVNTSSYTEGWHRAGCRSIADPPPSYHLGKSACLWIFTSRSSWKFSSLHICYYPLYSPL